MFYNYLNKNIAIIADLVVNLQTKPFIMDIKARIEEVIAQKGLTKREVSERMGKFNQAFNSLITNPKWDTIEHVAEAIGITTAELLYGNKDFPVKSDSEIDTEASIQKREQNASSSYGIIICPYCGKGIRLSLEKE